MKVTVRSYGQAQGKAYDEICIDNQDVCIYFSNLGARITSWEIKDVGNIVLGFDNAQACVNHRGYYYGATVGPVAGRIQKGQFKLGNQTYHLDQNDSGNHLHGGVHGWDLQQWEYHIVESDEEVAVHFSYVDTEVENYYPGEVTMKVIHRYSRCNRWTVEYQGISTDDTLMNPTNHVYFNLNGNIRESIHNHIIQADVNYFMPVNEQGLPLGDLLSVTETPFDLRQPVLVEDILLSDHPQIRLKCGLDHGFVFEGTSGPQVRLRSQESNLAIEINTDCPAMVLYSHSFAEDIVNVTGQKIYPYAGLAIETQMLPDAINQSGFGNIQLKANVQFNSSTTYQLIIDDIFNL